MIWTALATVGNVARKVPWQVWAVLGILVTAWVWGNHRYDAGYDARSEEYRQAALEAVQKARKADAVGQGAADASKGAVEARNAKAREAAQGSDDPLRDGLEALR